MELALLVYAVSLLSGLLGFLMALAMAAVMGVVISGGMVLDSYSDTSAGKRWLKRWLIALTVISFVSVIVPNERTAYMMVAAYATQKVAQTPEARETGEKVLTLINGKLDQLIQETQKVK